MIEFIRGWQNISKGTRNNVMAIGLMKTLVQNGFAKWIINTDTDTDTVSPEVPRKVPVTMSPPPAWSSAHGKQQSNRRSSR